MFSTFNILTISYQHTSQSGLIRIPRETIGEHLAIIEAICTRNSDGAERLMKHHLRKSGMLLASNIDNRI